MATLPPFEPTFEYGLIILSITLTTLGLLTIGGFLRGIFKGGGHHSFGKKLFFFPLFVVGIFAFGWFTAKLQGSVLEYLQKNVASSVVGLVIAVVIAWVLYDWVLWRRRN